MTDTETAAPSVRDTVEAAYASNSSSPDVGSIVNGAVEHRDREIKNRHRAAPRDSKEYEGDRSDRLRSTIRSAVHETKLKAASGSTQPAKHHEVAPGAPANWSLDAKAQWHDLPQQARLEVMRDQAETANAIQSKIAPSLHQYAEIDRELSTIRHLYQQHGLSDAQGMAKIARTISALHDPRTAVQAYHELGRELNIAPLGYQSQQQQYVQEGDPQAQYQAEQAAHHELSRFSKDKPHFENVRFRMGELIRDHGERYMSQGGIDLAKAYNDACREAGLGDNRARRAANVSPSSRSPAVRHDTSQHSGGGVRAAVTAAFREARGR